MLREIYIRPTGLYSATSGETAEEVWGGLNLAGGPFDFSAVEVIERNGAKVERRIASIGEFLERDWGRRTINAADMFELIRAPRPRMVGIDLARPRIMGIVNVTPDSFSDGGHLAATQAAIDHALRLEDEGADIIDIGGESTRPGSDPVGLDDELARVMPVIEGPGRQARSADLDRYAQGPHHVRGCRGRRRYHQRRISIEFSMRQRSRRRPDLACR